MAQLSDNPQGGVDGGQQNPKPSAEAVDDFHTNADTDSREESIHHTLGGLPTQASPGDHNHRDGKSQPILEGVTITGSRATDAWRLSINQILVSLGAEDLSSP